MAKSKTIKKTPHSSTPPQEPSEKESWWEEYTDMLSLQKKPVGIQFLNRFAEEMVAYFHTNQEAKRLTDFYATKHVTEKTVINWRKRCPLLDEACEYCKMLLGNRREEWAISNPNYNAGTLQRVMTHYSSVWHEDAIFKAKLKEIAEEKHDFKQEPLV